MLNIESACQRTQRATEEGGRERTRAHARARACMGDVSPLSIDVRERQHPRLFRIASGRIIQPGKDGMDGMDGRDGMA